MILNDDGIVVYAEEHQSVPVAALTSGWRSSTFENMTLPIKSERRSQDVRFPQLQGSRVTGARTLLVLGILLGAVFMPLAAQTPVPDRTIRVTLLGTGGGPLVNLEQYGTATLVEAGGLRLLFDCGRGATLRLAQAGIPIGSVSRVFLTHLHSDHIVQLPDLFLTGWVGAAGRRVPLEVWGPQGTADMMAALEKAFAFDIHVRRDVDERFPAEGIRTRAHEVIEGVVFDEAGLKVTAFLVDHAPIAPAFGYRVDYAGRSVVLSGDTRPSENLVKFAAGADVLIHEAVDPVTARARSLDPAVTEKVIAHHTTGEQAGAIFTRVKPRLAVYSHAPASDALIAQTRRTYAGPLQGAEDLLTIDIGDQVVVRRRDGK